MGKEHTVVMSKVQDMVMCMLGARISMDYKEYCNTCVNNKVCTKKCKAYEDIVTFSDYIFEKGNKDVLE